MSHVQVIMPRLKAMTWNMANQETEMLDPVAVINLKVPNQLCIHPKQFTLIPIISEKVFRKFEEEEEIMYKVLGSMKERTCKTHMVNVVYLLNIDHIVQLQNDAQSHSGELEVKFQLDKDTLETMLKSMYSIRDQLSDVVSVTLEVCLSIA